MVSNAIKSAQGQVEAQNFETRKNVLKYDDVLNRQRQVIYAERRRVLEGEDIHDQIEHMLSDTVDDYVRAATSDGYPEEWDLDQLWTALGTLYPVGVTVDELEESSGGDRSGLSADFIVGEITEDANRALKGREDDLGHDALRELERRVVLSVLDRKWREHLYEMDYLREGIGLRAMAQRDPLVEYQREGFDLFAAMMDGIKEESVGFIFNLEVEVEEEPAQPAAVQPDASMPFAVTPEIHAKGLDEQRREQPLQYSAPTLDGGSSGTASVSAAADQKSEFSGTPRNAPCPCGSGKKYKKCHGAPGAA
jgi:preprotein translocase subunit SecA